MHFVRKTTWDPLEQINVDAEAKAKRCVNKMVWFCMGDLKKAFLMWSQQAKILDESRKYGKCINIFESLNLVAKTNLDLVVNFKESKVKEDALDRIIQNAGNNLRDAFNRWKNHTEIMAI